MKKLLRTLIAGALLICNLAVAAEPHMLVNLDAVSHNNSWVDIGGDWRFEGCIQLDANSSHGQETVFFTETILTLEIDNYQTPDCQGPASVQILDFLIQRVDKTTALLDGVEVIANRYLLTEPVSGQVIPQLWYVDDRNEILQIAHGVLDSPTDEEGFPTELHTDFFARQ